MMSELRAQTRWQRAPNDWEGIDEVMGYQRVGEMAQTKRETINGYEVKEDYSSTHNSSLLTWSLRSLPAIETLHGVTKPADDVEKSG